MAQDYVKNFTVVKHGSNVVMVLCKVNIMFVSVAAELLL